MRRGLSMILLAVVAAVTLAAPSGLLSGVARAADNSGTAVVTTPPPDPTTTEAGSPVVTNVNLPPAPSRRVIPLPNSGVAPEASGDRGGWAQLTLLGLLLTAIVVVCTVVIRSTLRRTRGMGGDPA